jgi:hypothetical protein
VITGRVPTVFVSSTCYDLGQVRADIKQAIESLGYVAALSEHAAFPVAPELSAVENCLKVVDQDADIFLLIVGGRYGSTGCEGKSVTNLEYLRAKAKGIPAYVYVNKAILNNLAIWKDNKEGNFASVVDSTKLFEFVDYLQGNSGTWVFPFETAEDIMKALRNQLAYLFAECLQLRLSLKGNPLPPSLNKLHPDALNIVINRPRFWEYLLFSEVLSNELQACSNIKRDVTYGISLGKGESFTGVQCAPWLIAKDYELIRILNALERLANEACPEAVGPDGVAGDPEKIVYVAQRIGHAYREALEWKLDFDRLIVDEPFLKCAGISAAFANIVTEGVEKFDNELRSALKGLVENPPAPGEHRVINLQMVFGALPRMQELLDELNRLREIYG